MTTVFDHYSIGEIEFFLTKIEGMIRNGYEYKKIEQEADVKCFDEIFSIAKARIKNDKTKEKLYMNLGDLRFTTHEEVAKYRASRLKCNMIIDAGCGIGLQSIAFSKTCKKVIAIEIDERKARYALENFKKLGIKNVELITGDAIKIAKDIKKADIIFCDTERAAGETKRTLSTLKPDIKSLTDAYSGITKDFCIEVPPQTRSIGLKCEKEYISLNGNLNRLSLYFGKLMKADYSAIMLPSGSRVEGKKGKLPKKSDKVLSYLYEADEAVVMAGLLSKVTPKNVFLYSVEKQTLLTSDAYVKNGFFRQKYKVMVRCEASYNNIVEGLKKSDAGSVVLRAKVKPEDYWSERKKYESGLSGNKKLYLFIIGNEALIAELI